MREINDSETVRQVQQKLKAKGQDVESDGTVGPKTQKALRDYQQKEGIEASGKLDEQTCSSLGVQPKSQ